MHHFYHHNSNNCNVNNWRWKRPLDEPCQTPMLVHITEWQPTTVQVGRKRLVLLSVHFAGFLSGLKSLSSSLSFFLQLVLHSIWIFNYSIQTSIDVRPGDVDYPALRWGESFRETSKSPGSFSLSSVNALPYTGTLEKRATRPCLKRTVWSSRELIQLNLIQNTYMCAMVSNFFQAHLRKAARIIKICAFLSSWLALLDSICFSRRWENSTNLFSIFQLSKYHSEYLCSQNKWDTHWERVCVCVRGNSFSVFWLPCVSMRLCTCFPTCLPIDLLS